MTHVIEVKTGRNPTPEMSETYNIRISTFDDGKPEEFLALLKIAVDGTGTTSPSGQMNYLHMMLYRQSQRDFYELTSQNNGTTNGQLEYITECLIGCFFPINALFNQNCAMRSAMHKAQIVTFNIFAARLTEMNNFIPISPVSDASKNMPSEDLNKILLHAVTIAR